MTAHLYLVPNTLDFGVATIGPAPDLREVLPQQVIEVAARLAFWVAEDARRSGAGPIVATPKSSVLGTR